MSERKLQLYFLFSTISLWAFLWASMALVACITVDKPSVPPFIKDRAIIAKADAKQCLEGLGLKFPKEYPYKLEIIKGEKKIGNYWVWKAPQLNNMWVAGLTTKHNGSIILKVAGNKQGTGEVMDDILKHEFGHYWLIGAIGNYGHSKQYKKCFYNWVESGPKSLENIDTNNFVIAQGWTNEGEPVTVVK